jgi:hypothetical protein
MMLEMTVRSIIANDEIGECNIAIISDSPGVWTVFAPVLESDTHLDS